MSGKAELGVSGLAVMGANLARNVARHGFPIAVHNRTTERTRQFIAEHGAEGAIVGTDSLRELVAALARPRRILIMVKAGAAVDAVLDELAPLLDPGDIVLDGGNSHFLDSRRRTAACAERGLRFLGTGVSGGEEGALNGPSIMPGGDPDAYRALEPIFTSVAAQVDGSPCCTYVGADGAGHYVKMVHNGIEYADIQLIAESYDLLRHVAGLQVSEIAEVFARWNEGGLQSFLIEITAEVLAKRDPATGGPLVDVIVDEAEQKGTGRWTSQDALELGVPLTSITEAVFARSLSALSEQRIRAAEVLAGPRPESPGTGTGGATVPHHSAPTGQAAKDLVQDIEAALYASKIVAYAQGFEQMAVAAAQYGWSLRPGELARIWRGGCIIRARFLSHIHDAYGSDQAPDNLLLVPYFRDALASGQDAWRRTIAAAVHAGVPVPAFSSALAYYDGYRRARGPAALIQGLRDYFGAHTYRRVDRPGTFHVRWPQDGDEVEA